MDTLPDPFKGTLLVTSLQLQLAPKQSRNQAALATERAAETRETEARSVEQHFAIEVACTDAQAAEHRPAGQAEQSELKRNSSQFLYRYATRTRLDSLEY